ncbi:metal ion binding [Ascochyta rabiei]|uniref:Metal ion binding n=2 Tax=Didymella rabiei TaxID=5454 RepID=A0A162YGJ6_DIDRA|nr:metal ion binding [Ascochyta rabiei]
MASLCDSMDDFFDFEQLERDSTLYGNGFDAGHENDMLDHGVMAMDWQPVLADVPALPLSDGNTPRNESTQQLDDRPTQQYPLSEVLHQPPALLIPQAAALAWPVEHLPTPGGYRQHHQLDYPPSSSLQARDAICLASRDTNDASASDLCSARKTPLLPHGPTQSSSNDMPITQSKHFPLLTARASLPTRHASSASWKPASAKRKGPQSRIPIEARQMLEEEFAANPYPHGWEMEIIAHQANLDVKKVRNWFNNTRARKKGQELDTTNRADPFDSTRSLKPKLSKDDLEALGQQADEAVQLPQPPLALYLAQSYQEEGVDLTDLQAAMDSDSFSGSGYSDRGAWSASRRGSAVDSIVSSEGTAPTTYTVSSNGSRSNVSSFGRERRRGRRRMAWNESPHTRSINGVNSAGQPQQDLPFFCTFCPRAFKTKYEWIRHEDSVHALRTTWICCDTRSASLLSCPFCGHMHPDEAHMATHKYHQCRSKPEAQRTFYRRDHFVQHLHHVHFANAKHPSVRVGCQARLLASEGHNFGCKELSMKWRKFGAPMKKDDPMLHCGFCGKKSKDWSERCEHVAEHLVAHELNRSVWWPDRKENHLENLYSTTPFESFRCRYCLKVFTDIQAMNEHSHCRVWSCRFLQSFDDVAAENAGPPLCPDFPSAKAHHCHLCGTGYRAVHIEHAHNYHRYRSCNQEFYESEDAFLQHLHNFHGASQPALLRGNAIIEQTFMRNKGASFEPVEFNESMQPCHMDLTTTPLTPFTVEKPGTTAPLSERRDQKQLKKYSPVRKQSVNTSTREPAEASKAPRQRSDTATTKADSHEPRFVRLSTYIPFTSSRIFYSRSPKSSEVPRDAHAVLEEMPKPHLTSLVMSAGLISMAVARWTIKPEKHSKHSMVELVLEEAVD